MNQRVVMEGIVYDNQRRALIVQRSEDESFPNKWELPSGKVEIGENPIEALERELEEEVNIKVTASRCVNVRDYTTSDRHNVLIAYIMEPLNDNHEKVALSEEHQDFAWVSEQEISGYDIIGPVQNDLEQAWNEGR